MIGDETPVRVSSTEMRPRGSDAMFLANSWRVTLRDKCGLEEVWVGDGEACFVC